MFYEYSQNNSGGSFDVDDKLCHRLVIEADDEEKASSIAEGLGCYWNGVAEGLDCECCGDRWYSPYKGLEFPYKYASFTKQDADKIASTYDAEAYKTNEKKPYGDRVFGVEFKKVEAYVQYMADLYGWTSPDARIFYKDGTVKEINSNRLKK